MADVVYPPVGGSVVQRVLLCARHQRREAGRINVSSSLPGHLIQLMLTGRTMHEANGRRYMLEPGHLIWYHEDEMVRTQIQRAPWSFYTLNFIAPGLTPPSFEHRVRQVGAPIRKRFAQVLAAWEDLAAAPAVRELRVVSAVLALLAELSVDEAEPFAMDPSTELWWALETQLRRDLSQPVSLSLMSQMTGRSQGTIARSCRAAVGMAPMKRVKAIRMSLARGLVCRSDLQIGQVAQRVGYARVHEFSRDYRKHFHVAPTQDRRNGTAR